MPTVPTVLVIEDDFDVADLIEAALCRQFTIEKTWSRDEAAKNIERGNCPDAIVMDCMMPGMGPDEFLAVVRKQRPNIPVVLQTAAAEGVEIAERLKATYLSKPWQVEVLLSVVTDLVTKTSR